jgi:hypothetical protein
MDARVMFFLAGIVVFVATLTIVAAYYYRRASLTSARSWEQLLERLALVDRDGVAQIALAYVDESGQRSIQRLLSLQKSCVSMQERSSGMWRGSGVQRKEATSSCPSLTMRNLRSQNIT